MAGVRCWRSTLGGRGGVHVTRVNVFANQRLTSMLASNHSRTPSRKRKNNVPANKYWEPARYHGLESPRGPIPVHSSRMRKDISPDERLGQYPLRRCTDITALLITEGMQPILTLCDLPYPAAEPGSCLGMMSR